MALKTTAQIIEEVRAIPTKVLRTEDELCQAVIILKDEKNFFWTEIAEWMKENTEFYRSPTFWKQMYITHKAGKELQPTET